MADRAHSAQRRSSSTSVRPSVSSDVRIALSTTQTNWDLFAQPQALSSPFAHCSAMARRSVASSTDEARSAQQPSVSAHTQSGRATLLCCSH